ncbi:MAG: PD-(D/E)XK nuclease domain-containing protein [Muribaculaceae bacterium]|nr:PD-(D/E)XK nuclease domain-containing protein [Muribaculaceae bacterium]
MVSSILENIRDGEPQALVRNLDIFFAGIPYEMKMENENNLHNAIYVLLTLIGIDVETEVHTSDGRIDLLIITDAYIYIIKLKFDSDTQSAITQIEEKGYARPYLNDPRRIFLIGANFSSRTRHFDKPEIREVEK